MKKKLKTKKKKNKRIPTNKKHLLANYKIFKKTKLGLVITGKDPQHSIHFPMSDVA